jgi:23S rRNA pseudouridine1911/1915/1917 synthase
MTSFTVSRLEEGWTLLDFLEQRLKLSRRQTKALIDTRNVWVNRKRVWIANHRLRAGDQVSPQIQTTSTTTNIKIRILNEDAHFLFVDKPAGILSSGIGSVEELLRKQLNLPDLHVVHRLDRDTSGCLMVARTVADFDAAVLQFKARRIKKIYNAIVHGRVELRTSTINTELEGKRAVTHIRVLKTRAEASFLQIRIETGRTHQIRLHLSSIRHPVLGDSQYGPKRITDQRIRDIPRQMLHSTEIEMRNPFGAGNLRAHSPLPADFRKVLRAFAL